MKRTIYSISFLAGLFFFSLISCREEIKKHRIFRMNQVQNVESLDPAFAKNQYIMWQVYQCYNRLVEFDESMQPVPSLALRWDISSDRTLYTFHLRTDVYFHDNEVFPGGKGRRMTASDVVYSFNRITDEKTASPGAWIFNDRVDSVQPFTALNDSTFQLKLQKPFYPVLGILSMMYCSIVPHEGVEKWGKDFRSHPCGTGPFVFQEWEEAVAITYTRNEHYWEVDSQGKRLPYIDGIKCTQVDSKATEFLMFMQGDLDFMNSIDAVFKDQILNRRGELKPKYRKAFRLQKHPYLNVEYLGFLMNDSLNTQKILLNKKIRQAINYGFDRKKLVTYIRNNIGIAAEAGMVPPALPGFDSSQVHGYRYDPEKARQLLDEVKKEMGGTLPEITLLSNDNYSDRCYFVSSQLEELGLKIKVEIMLPSLLREQMSNGKAAFFWATWIADYPDAEAYLTLFYGANDSPPNYTRFRNRNYDSLYRAVLTEKVAQKRLALIQAMDRIVIQEAPVVPLFYDEVMHFVRNRVHHFNTNSSNLIDLKRIELDPE